MLLFLMTLVLVMVLSGCNEEQKIECPEAIYPELKAINKVPTIEVTVKDGMMDSNSTKKAFKTIKALRVSEHYYWTIIGDYRREFLK